MNTDIKRFLKTKIKYYGNEVTELQKADSNHTCLAVISLDAVLKKDENYCPQVFLNECKYIKKNIIWNITQDIEMLFSDSDEE